MKNEKESYRGKLAVVTGASSGIGFELAKKFAMEGFDLLVCAEDVGIMPASDKFREFGTEVEALQLDLSREEGVEKLYSRMMRLNKPVAAVALNAGVGVGGEFTSTNLDEELRMIDLNVISIVRLTKKIIPLLAKDKGRILFTSAVSADMPGPYFAVYAATKSFVQSFSEAIREEVKERGISVTSLQPGPTDTNFFARANMLDTKAAKSEKDSPAEVARDGYYALMAGKDHVVAGALKNRVQDTLAKLIPETAAAKLQGKDVKPDSLRH